MNTTELQQQIDQLQAELDHLKNGEPEFKEGRWFVPEFKEGKWFVFDLDYISGQWLHYITKIKNGSIYGYGFNGEGGWSGDGVIAKIDDASNIRPANPKKIKKALIREYERRIPVGKKYDIELRHSANGFNHTFYPSLADFEYDITTDTLYDDDRIVYKQEEWAEIIEDEPIMINEHEVKFKGMGNVDVGCKTFYDPHSVFGVLNSFIKKWDITISRKGEDITEQIKKIAEKI